MTEKPQSFPESRTTPLEWIDRQLTPYLTEWDNRTHKLSEAELALHEKYRTRINEIAPDGVLPHEFKYAAVKETAIGAGALLLQGAGLAAVGIGEPVTGIATGYLYDKWRRQGGMQHADLPKLKTSDWIISGAFTMFTVNPIFIGGIRNLAEANRILRDIEMQKKRK